MKPQITENGFHWPPLALVVVGGLTALLLLLASHAAPAVGLSHDSDDSKGRADGRGEEGASRLTDPSSGFGPGPEVMGAAADWHGLQKTRDKVTVAVLPFHYADPHPAPVRSLDHLRTAGAVAVWEALGELQGVIRVPATTWPGLGSDRLPTSCIAGDVGQCRLELGQVDYLVQGRFSPEGGGVRLELDLLGASPYARLSRRSTPGATGGGLGERGEASGVGLGAVSPAGSVFPILQRVSRKSSNLKTAKDIARMAGAFALFPDEGNQYARGEAGVPAPEPPSLTDDNYAFVLFGRALNRKVLSPDRDDDPSLRDLQSTLRRTLRVDPNLTVAREVLAMALHKDGRRQEAGGEMEKALHERQRHIRSNGSLWRADSRLVSRTGTLRWLAGVWKEEGAQQKAASALQKAIDQDPDDMASRRDLAEILIGQGDLAEAEKLLSRVLEHHPLEPRTIRLSAEIAANRGEVEEMVEALVRLLQVKPCDRDASLKLAAALSTSGERGEAMDAYRRSLVCFPGDGMLSWGLALQLREEGRLDEAIQVLQQVVEEGPPPAGPALLLGEVLIEEDRAEEASRMYLDLARGNSESPVIQQAAGVALMELGRYRDAARTFEDAARLEPRSPVHQHNLAIALLSAGNVWGADNAFMRGSALDPDHYGLRFNRGLLFVGLDRMQDAAMCFRQAIRADRKKPEAHHNLAVALRRMGRSRASRRALETYREIVPSTD